MQWLSAGFLVLYFFYYFFQKTQKKLSLHLLCDMNVYEDMEIASENRQIKQGKLKQEDSLILKMFFLTYFIIIES